LSDQSENSTPPKSDTRSDPAALGVHLFQLKVRERSRLMLKAVAVRPEAHDIITRYNPAANRPDPVSEVRRAIDLFRKFLVDVERIGREELKPKGEMDTSEFIREKLRPQFFTVFGEYKEILWQAVTDIPGYILETYWPPAKKVFQEKIGDDDLAPAKARGSLKAEWDDHFDIEIGRLERQESQPKPCDGQAQTAPEPDRATAGPPSLEAPKPPGPGSEESKGASGKAAPIDRRAFVATKIQRTPNGTITNEEAAIYFGVVPKTIRAWINGEVPTKRLTSGVRRGTVTNESIVRLEKKLQSASEE
jgi:hypothetical protein